MAPPAARRVDGRSFQRPPLPSTDGDGGPGPGRGRVNPPPTALSSAIAPCQTQTQTTTSRQVYRGHRCSLVWRRGSTPQPKPNPATNPHRHRCSLVWRRGSGSGSPSPVPLKNSSSSSSAVPAFSSFAHAAPSTGARMRTLTNSASRRILRHNTWHRRSDKVAHSLSNPSAAPPSSTSSLVRPALNHALNHSSGQSCYLLVNY